MLRWRFAGRRQELAAKNRAVTRYPRVLSNRKPDFLHKQCRRRGPF